MVGTDEQEYSESESDSTTASSILTDSFFTSFALSVDSNLSGQPVAIWSTLILRHQKQPLLFLKYSRSPSVSLTINLGFPVLDLVDTAEEVPAGKRVDDALEERGVE